MGARFGLSGTIFQAAEEFGRLVHKIDNCRDRSYAQNVSLPPTAALRNTAVQSVTRTMSKLLW
jgi:hypothetical protein